MDRRTPLHRLPRDQRLQQRPDAGAGKIAVATLLERPAISDHTEDHVSCRGRAFFGDEEVQLARIRRPETRKQSLCRDGVLNEVDVAI